MGFTGTRRGLTAAQEDSLSHLLGTLGPVAAHHGCCVGADAEFHDLVRDGWPGCRVEGHPSDVPRLVSDCLADCDVRHPAKRPLERNRDIVRAAGVLVACPETAAEEWRSGTWATVRAARKRGLRVYVVRPDGGVLEEGPACS